MLDNKTVSDLMKQAFHEGKIAGEARTSKLILDPMTSIYDTQAYERFKWLTKYHKRKRSALQRKVT